MLMLALLMGAQGVAAITTFTAMVQPVLLVQAPIVPIVLIAETGK